MSYWAVLTYHPSIATFARPGVPGRGAWRVRRCVPGVTAGERPFISIGRDYGSHTNALFMDVPRRLTVGTYVNPTKLLRELFAKRLLEKYFPNLKEKAA
jgi:hypothetical protein